MADETAAIGDKLSLQTTLDGIFWLTGRWCRGIGNMVIGRAPLMVQKSDPLNKRLT
jgi:hypothetical protein